jgi:hypothetical protein
MEAEFSFYNPKHSYQAVYTPPNLRRRISSHSKPLQFVLHRTHTVSIIPFKYQYVYIYLNLFSIPVLIVVNYLRYQTSFASTFTRLSYNLISEIHKF